MSKRKRKNKVVKLTEEEYGKYISNLKNEIPVGKSDTEDRGVYDRDS